MGEVGFGIVIGMSENTANDEGANRNPVPLVPPSPAAGYESATNPWSQAPAPSSTPAPPYQPPSAAPFAAPAAGIGPPSTGQPRFDRPSVGQSSVGQSGVDLPPFTQTLYPPPPVGGSATGPPAVPGGWRRVAVAGVAGLAIALAAGGIGGFVGYAMHDDNSPLQTVTDSSNRVVAPVVDRSSLAQIAATVQPSVVVIDTGSGEGSGVIISADGYIVTNNHVVSGARGSTVQVTFNSGKRVQASIVGTDPRTDLAVVKASGASGLQFATWGDSDAVQVGDTVLAIGSPLGLQGSVTAGIVSALHRTITVGDSQQSPFDTGSARTTIGDAIQTDAPINPGNSGGALVNTEGKVIGINSAIATSGSTGNIGVGFAISANKAKSVANQIIKGGKVSHPYLGVSVDNADNGGAQIQQVQAGSPADKAGLKVGDVIIKVNDRVVSGREDLVGAIQSGTAGVSMKLTIVRGGSQQTVTVTLGDAQ